MYEQERESGGVAALVGFTIVFLAGLWHLLTWDQFSLEVIPLKSKQILGIAQPAELSRVAEICAARRKVACQETALWEAYVRDRGQKELLVKLGELQMKRKDYTAALRTYTAYFHDGGNNLDARYEYAKALGETGQMKDAKKHFQYILKVTRDPVVLPERARTYVKLLMKHNDLQTARHVIVSTRKANRRAAYFLEKELKEIDSRLNRRS